MKAKKLTFARLLYSTRKKEKNKGEYDMLKINGFITNLGKYNEGYLVGKWITFPINEEEEKEILKEIGINKWYEEYFFTDWDGCPGLQEALGEFPSIQQVNELAERLEEIDDEEKLSAILEYDYSNLREAIDNYDSYEYISGVTLEEYAVELVECCYNLPEFALMYFDYERLARDMSFDGYVETTNGVLYVC